MVYVVNNILKIKPLFCLSILNPIPYEIPNNAVLNIDSTRFIWTYCMDSKSRMGKGYTLIRHIIFYALTYDLIQ